MRFVVVDNAQKFHFIEIDEKSLLQKEDEKRGCYI